MNELTIHLAPILLGRGVRLFDHLRTNSPASELGEVIHSPTVTHLNYRVRR